MRSDDLTGEFPQSLPSVGSDERRRIWGVSPDSTLSRCLGSRSAAFTIDSTGNYRGMADRLPREATRRTQTRRRFQRVDGRCSARIAAAGQRGRARGIVASWGSLKVLRRPRPPLTGKGLAILAWLSIRVLNVLERFSFASRAEFRAVESFRASRYRFARQFRQPLRRVVREESPITAGVVATTTGHFDRPLSDRPFRSDRGRA